MNRSISTHATARAVICNRALAICAEAPAVIFDYAVTFDGRQKIRISLGGRTPE